MKESVLLGTQTEHHIIIVYYLKKSIKKISVKMVLPAACLNWIDWHENSVSTLWYVVRERTDRLVKFDANNCLWNINYR